MKRSVWKWIFGISLTVLALLILFTVGLWALGNAVAALACAMMSYTDDAFAYKGASFGEFMANFIGSPLFYIYLIDVTALVTSVVALVIMRKQRTR